MPTIRRIIMFILGIQGSPRINGNSRYLLTSFLKECEKYGATTQSIDACKADILPCKELIVCEKKGYCPLKDDMETSIYALIRRADIVVLASPVFFYNVTAQVKTLIDRCQMFWGRKYKLRLKDPHSYSRQGFLLSVAASGGGKLFDGVHLTARYFFDAISANYQGHLTYKKIESAKQIRSHPGVIEDIKKAVKDLCNPFLEKKSLLFISKHDAVRGQIARAYAKILSKGELIVLSAGFDAKEKIPAGLVAAMAKRKLDLMYEMPQNLADIDPALTLDYVINLDPEKEDKKIPAGKYLSWTIQTPCDSSPESLNLLIDELASRIKTLVASIG